jgi:hypothetical protein
MGYPFRSGEPSCARVQHGSVALRGGFLGAEPAARHAAEDGADRAGVGAASAMRGPAAGPSGMT